MRRATDGDKSLRGQNGQPAPTTENEAKVFVICPLERCLMEQIQTSLPSDPRRDDCRNGRLTFPASLLRTYRDRLKNAHTFALVAAREATPKQSRRIHRQRGSVVIPSLARSGTFRGGIRRGIRLGSRSGGRRVFWRSPASAFPPGRLRPSASTKPRPVFPSRS